MRLLVVDVNYDYKNPMYRQFYNYLTSCMEVDFFGPGYVDRNSLEEGVDRFIEGHGGYDAVLEGAYFLYSAIGGLRYDAYSVHRNVIPYYNINDAWQCCRTIYRDLLQLNNIIKIIAYYEDYVSIPEMDYKELKKLLEYDFFILSFPEEMMRVYPRRKLRQYTYLSNYSLRLIEESGNRYIPIYWNAMTFEEIFYRSYAEREYDWCVPGTKNLLYYPERVSAYQHLMNSGVRIWETDPYQTLSVFSIESRHLNWYHFRNLSEKLYSAVKGKNKYISSYPKLDVIAACREHYRESLRRSKIVYAEGGTGECLVRKYLETCAMGALLVAQKVPGITEMGFRHKENCILVDKVEDLKWVVEQYKNEEENAKIAKAGQKLILDKHMFVHRAQALADTIKAIQEKRYGGAVWKDGRYIIKTLEQNVK